MSTRAWGGAGGTDGLMVELPGRSRIVDISQTFEERMPLWSGSTRFFHSLCTSYWHGDLSIDFQLEFNEHTGTHVDAPAHFVKEEDHPAHKWVDQLDPGMLIRPARVIDFHEIGPCGVVTADMIARWEARRGELSAGDVAIFDLGWAQHWSTLPAGRQYIEDWPYLSRDCAELLVDRAVQAIGTDTLTPDPSGSTDYPVHRTLLPSGVLIVENLANLRQLPERCFFVSLPLKIKQGSGSPLRAIALVPGENAGVER